MTVKEYRKSTSLEQQKEFAKKLHCWLKPYTQAVYEKVMSQIDTILSDEFTLKLIDELFIRTQREDKDEISQIAFSLGHESDYKYTLHCHPLEHSKSYRDILYDMYIK